jgi:predicted metal-dependent phosphoesterase TrpH
MIEDLLRDSGLKRTKVELHCHTALHSMDSNISPKELVTMAEASGYDVLFITEHQRVWSEQELATLHELSDKVKIFPGIEISFPDGVDILVLGASDPIYESLTSPDAVFAQATVDGYCTIIAHPFRWMNELPKYCALADATESRTCNHGAEDKVEKAQAYAQENRMAAVYASDAHGLNYMNKFWIETHEPFETIEEFRRLLITEKYDNCQREFDMPLPPNYKASGLSELSEEDLAALDLSHAPQS